VQRKKRESVSSCPSLKGREHVAKKISQEEVPIVRQEKSSPIGPNEEVTIS